jgi:hypothetical protein
LVVAEVEEEVMVLQTMVLEVEEQEDLELDRIQ